MAFAYGMHGMAFGLGFLNFIGTILFFIFVFMAVKFVIRGLRYSYGHNGDSQRSWGSPWKHQHRDHHRAYGQQDEALKVARERFASGEIDEDSYQKIKDGLRVEVSEDGHWKRSKHDSALELARLRFARGELSPEEFEAVKKALS